MGSINVDRRGLGRNDIRSKREIQIDGAQGIMWFVCPASMNVMTPAHRQFNVDVLFNAGMLHNRTVGDPGTQGAGVAGMQGIGVKTPIAAAVAAITMGFEGDWHMPKGGIFIIGTWSMMLAAIT